MGCNIIKCLLKCIPIVVLSVNLLTFNSFALPDYPMYIQTIVLGGDAQTKYNVIANSGFPGVIWELDAGGLPAFVETLSGGEVELYATYRNLDEDWDQILTVIGETESNIVVPICCGYQDDQAVADALIELADKVSPQGRKIMIYPHNGYHVETSQDAVDILELVNRPDEVGFVFSNPHMMMYHNSRSIEYNVVAELENAMPYIMTFSMCGSDVGSSDWNTLINPLGEGTSDNLQLVKTLLEMGYQGNFSMLTYGIPGDPNVWLADSYTEWVSILDSLAAFEGCMDPTSATYDPDATINPQKPYF